MLRTASPEIVRQNLWEGRILGTKGPFYPEFRGAVCIVKETGWPVAQVARDLRLNECRLHNWVKKDWLADSSGNGGVHAVEVVQGRVVERVRTRGACTAASAEGRDGRLGVIRTMGRVGEHSTTLLPRRSTPR
ncbi:hypothetical protein E1289_17510 [Actinomadura sp. 6K520]|nr:hypothetical protein E1289_17510 [Actinomadura sp. 6K520]